MLTGYDHLLFIFGVIFFLTSFKDVVKFTLFFYGRPLPHNFCNFFQNNSKLLSD